MRKEATRGTSPRPREGRVVYDGAVVTVPTVGSDNSEKEAGHGNNVVSRVDREDAARGET